MELRTIDIKLNDLPKEIDIEFPSQASESELKEMLDNLKAQVAYNSRSDDSAAVMEPKVKLIQRYGDSVRLEIFR